LKLKYSGSLANDKCLPAYAVYFDHRRRTDPNFRKQLKRESRRQARAAKEEAEAYIIRQREMIKGAVAEAKEEGFPTEVEEKEAYFMNEVARGEQLSQDGMNPPGFECVFHFMATKFSLCILSPDIPGRGTFGFYRLF
jgi:MAS20 protein import receptor